MGVREEILRVCPRTLRLKLASAVTDYRKLQELRVRVGQPVFLRIANREWMLTESGMLSAYAQNAPGAEKELLTEMFEYLCDYSVYAAEEELREGYLTIQGGHRVGICGTVLREAGGRGRIGKLGSINVRIAHACPGCALEVVRHFHLLKMPVSILIASPPACGKTTLLRDLVRQLSYAGVTVGVVDERSEIAACYEGVPQMDLGPRCDVMDACKKKAGMEMLLRAMSPSVLAVDEIGGGEDTEALHQAFYCGCAVIATIHAGSREEVFSKRNLQPILGKGGFEGLVVLSDRNGAGTIEEMEELA